MIIQGFFLLIALQKRKVGSLIRGDLDFISLSEMTPSEILNGANSCFAHIFCTLVRRCSITWHVSATSVDQQRAEKNVSLYSRDFQTHEVICSYFLALTAFSLLLVLTSFLFSVFFLAHMLFRFALLPSVVLVHVLIEQQIQYKHNREKNHCSSEHLFHFYDWQY